MVVFHEDGVVVQALQTGRAQQVRQAIGALLKLAVRHHFARAGHDEGGALGGAGVGVSCVHLLLLVRSLPSQRQDLAHIVHRAYRPWVGQDGRELQGGLRQGLQLIFTQAHVA